jgi:hypothetical protein
MWGIATTTVSLSDVGYWLGVGLWTLFIGSIWGMILSALRRRPTNPKRRSATEPQPTPYQHAA